MTTLVRRRAPAGTDGKGASLLARIGWALATGIALVSGVPGVGHAQAMRGSVVDADSGRPVPQAGVFLLSRDREVVRQTMADSLGRFAIEAPRAGEYYLVGQSLGYAQTLSSLLAVGDRTYELDIELVPDPIRLDPLSVSVQNEELLEWFRFRAGLNPTEGFGFRAIQGTDLAEARQRARDNTDMLRWLYIPVSHATEACLGHRFLELPRGRGAAGPPACGRLFLDGYERPVEHLESLDRWSIGVVVVIPPDVYLFTRGFDWSFRPGGG